jgi:hypothetical protein
VTYLTERQKSSVLRIGSDAFDRSMLAGVACYHFTAAANLSRLLNNELRVANTRELFDKIDPARLAIPRLGAVSLAVLGAAFEAKGIGGKSPLESWFQKHRDSTISFYSLKHQTENDAKPTTKPGEKVHGKRRNK